MENLEFRSCVLSKARGRICSILCLTHLSFKQITSLFFQMNPARLTRRNLCYFFIFFLILQAKLIVYASVIALATLDYNYLFGGLQTLRLWAEI